GGLCYDLSEEERKKVEDAAGVKALRESMYKAVPSLVPSTLTPLEVAQQKSHLDACERVRAGKPVNSIKGQNTFKESLAIWTYHAIKDPANTLIQNDTLTTEGARQFLDWTKGTIKAACTALGNLRKEQEANRPALKSDTAQPYDYSTIFAYSKMLRLEAEGGSTQLGFSCRSLSLFSLLNLFFTFRKSSLDVTKGTPIESALWDYKRYIKLIHGVLENGKQHSTLTEASLLLAAPAKSAVGAEARSKRSPNV
ncbi:hypothetical protein P7C70_g8645, partial [Phenoliferia sp. Uapishka_3]